jgi:hypothetical protein
LKCQSAYGIQRECERTCNPGLKSLGRGCEDMNTYKAVRNHWNCAELYSLGKSAWEQALGKIFYVFRIMRWCLCAHQIRKELFMCWILSPIEF